MDNLTKIKVAVAFLLFATWVGFLYFPVANDATIITFIQTILCALAGHLSNTTANSDTTENTDTKKSETPL